MYRERIKKLIDILKSGDYKQGREKLRSNDKYCCLGVAEDIRGCQWEKNIDNSDYYLIKYEQEGYSEPLLESGHLTPEGRNYYGFRTGSGYFQEGGFSRSLIELNDSADYSFKRIADKIEYCLNNPATKLFIPEVYNEQQSLPDS